MNVKMINKPNVTIPGRALFLPQLLAHFCSMKIREDVRFVRDKNSSKMQLTMLSK